MNITDLPTSELRDLHRAVDAELARRDATHRRTKLTEAEKRTYAIIRRAARKELLSQIAKEVPA